MAKARTNLALACAAWALAGAASLALVGCGGGGDGGGGGDAGPAGTVENASALDAGSQLAGTPVVGQATESPSAPLQDPAATTPTDTGQALPVAADLQQTGRVLDVAIQGEGAFVLRDPLTGHQVLSRLGHFDVDAQGRLINSEGWLLTGSASGQPLPTFDTLEPLPPIRFLSPPAATSKLSLAVNLNASAGAIAANPGGLLGLDPNDASAYNHATSFEVYDRQGNAVPVTLIFQKSGQETWNVYAIADSVAVNPDAGGRPQVLAVLQFSASGGAPINPIDANLPLPSTTITVPRVPLWQGGWTEVISPVELDFTQFTQYATSFGVFQVTVDGYPAGQLGSVAILPSGELALAYTNGQTDRSRRLMLSRPTVADRLQRFGSSGWLCGQHCSPPLVAFPAQSLTGPLVAGALNLAY